MEKYKICPSCNTKNEPTRFECVNCESDLTSVKITDEETEKMTAENTVTQPEAPKKLVRLCECGMKNAPNARKCSACNEDISDITPIADVETQQAVTHFVMSSLDGLFAYKINAEETIVGRENAMSEYLSNKSYVSRYHAKLALVNGEFFIENLSNTNFTYVNNNKIAKRTQLLDGDQVGLGGTNVNGKIQEQAAYFLVRIGQCM